MSTPTPDPEWDDVIRSFQHLGPGGDAALAAAHPSLVDALREIPVGSTLPVAGQAVTRQSPDRWAVDDDANLASPWVVVQSLRSGLLHGGS